VQVIEDLFFIQIQWTAFEMKGNVSKAAGVIGQGALTFTGEFNRTLKLSVQFIKFRYRNTGPLYGGTTFFS
jgi:hypothetical protein